MGISKLARNCGGAVYHFSIAVSLDRLMFGVAEVTATATATVTTEIAAVMTVTKTTPSLLVRHVGHFSATKLTIIFDG